MAFLFSPSSIRGYLRQYGYAFSWKRAWNFSKVMASMGLSWATRNPVVWGKPFVLMVEPTNYCNLKCPLCPSGNGDMTRARGKMNLDDFKSLIDRVGGDLVLLMLWNQGEPFLNRCFTQMVEYAHAKRIPTLTSTNGHFVRTAEQARDVIESGLDEIIVSLDGVDQETYQQYRVGGEIEKVFDCVRLLVREKARLGKRTPLINLQFIVFKHNEGDLEEAERIAGDLGVDKFLLKTAQVYTDDDASEFLPETEEFNRYENVSHEGLAVKGQPKWGCKVLWYSSMVNWNGKVAPCCFDKNGSVDLGRAFGDESFHETWRGRAYMDFRRTILRDRTKVPMCNNCSEGYTGMFSLIKEMRG